MDGDGLLDERGGKGRRVKLKTDPTQDARDRYQRLLAYARVTGGPQLNRTQVARGWAKVYVYRQALPSVPLVQAGAALGEVSWPGACGASAAATSTGPLRRAPPVARGRASPRCGWRSTATGRQVRIIT